MLGRLVRQESYWLVPRSGVSALTVPSSVLRLPLVCHVGTPEAQNRAGDNGASTPACGQSGGQLVVVNGSAPLNVAGCVTIGARQQCTYSH